MHMTLCTFVTKCINQVFQGIEEKMHKQLAISKFVPVKTRDKSKYQLKLINMQINSNTYKKTKLIMSF